MSVEAKEMARKNGNARTPSELLTKPYARILTPDADSGTYTAEILEFPGCIADGNTPDEAYANLEAAARAWIEACAALGQDIPQPLTSQGYAGKIALRLPRSLHRRASEMAERDGTSLNQFLVAAVAERVGAVSLYRKLLDSLPGRLQLTTYLFFVGTESRNTVKAGPEITLQYARGVGTSALGRNRLVEESWQDA